MLTTPAFFGSTPQSRVFAARPALTIPAGWSRPPYPAICQYQAGTWLRAGQSHRFAVPAGSVYFLEGDSSPSLSPMPSLTDRPEDGLQGWGCYLTGVWNYA